MKEVGWPSLESRRVYSRHIIVYKITHNLTPAYMKELLPERLGRHQARHQNKYAHIRARTARYHQSTIPTSIRAWNNLEEDVRTSTSVAVCKKKLKKKMFSQRPEHLGLVKGPSSIQHTRLRLGMSPLRFHLHKLKIMPDAICQQCEIGEEETPRHFLLRCPQYTAYRQNLCDNLRLIVGGLGININNNTPNVLDVLLNGQLN